MHTCSILCGSYAQIYCCIDMLHHISWFSKFVVSTNIPASQLPQPHAPSTKTLQLESNQAATSHALLHQHTIQSSPLAQACHGQCVPVAHHGAMLAFNVSMLPTH